MRCKSAISSNSGVHSANAHQANSLSEEALLSNWVTGSLTQGQNRTISRIEIALRDDSPDDGVGGAAYFPAGSDIFITYRDGRVDSGREIRFEPVVEGGAPRPGFIEANGNDEIRPALRLRQREFHQPGHSPTRPRSSKWNSG